MSDPVEVTMVRTSEQNARSLVGFLVWLFAGAGIITVTVPLFTVLSPAYWDAVVFLLCVRIVLARPTRWLDWARKDGES